MLRKEPKNAKRKKASALTPTFSLQLNQPDPQDSFALYMQHVQRGKSFSRQAMFKEAMVEFTKALELRPNGKRAGNELRNARKLLRELQSVTNFGMYRFKFTNEKEGLQKRAKKIAEIKKKCHLTFAQAYSYLSMSQLDHFIWLLQGTQLITKGVLSAEMYIHLTSFIVSLSPHDTEKLLCAENNQLFKNCINSLAVKLSSDAISPDNYIETHKQVAENYQRRRIR